MRTNQAKLIITQNYATESHHGELSAKCEHSEFAICNLQCKIDRPFWFLDDEECK